MLCMWTQEHFHQLPALVKDHIESALSHGHGERTWEDVASELIEGSKQLWLATLNDKFIATVVTHIIDYPKKRTCEVCYLGGEQGEGVIEALGLVSTIEEWAKLNNCDDMQVFGRRGWLRALSKEGYSERYTILGKEL